jgi:hypothetical protein
VEERLRAAAGIEPGKCACIGLLIATALVSPYAFPPYVSAYRTLVRFAVGPGAITRFLRAFVSGLMCGRERRSVGGHHGSNRRISRNIVNSERNPSWKRDSLDGVVCGDAIHAAEPQKVNWTNNIVFALLHGGALAALFMFSWDACATAIFLHWMTAGLGISMGYHRLHTHRSYRVPLAFEHFFAVCATLTLQGGPIFWVATHRIHHQKSDQPGDPHSPRDGGWWAHVGWLLVGESKHGNTPLMSKYAPDLAKDPFYVWLNTYHWVPLIVLAFLLFAIGCPLRALGHLPPGRCRSPRYLAGQLGYPHVGHAPICHP